jgi:SAM-dependent methyltransferase
MKKLDIDCLATIQFKVSWKSSEAKHTECYLGRKVNLWRDIFPPGMKEALMGHTPGNEVTLSYQPGQAVPQRSPRDIVNTGTGKFSGREFLGRRIIPARGRFYPGGMLGGPRFFSEDIRPVRIASLNEKDITADCAHPLADRELTFSAVIENLAAKDCETGGNLAHWPEVILGSGPGMQARINDQPTDFSTSGFDRADKSPDPQFYEKPRLINHIDGQAMSFLSSEYKRLITPGMEVLDLMSSAITHLPRNQNLRVSGLGLNAQEMAANPGLDSYLVHDLNAEPGLPYADSSFDAVLCSLSMEYLTRPYEVVKEIARVLRPGGIIAAGVSNRWFPPKVTRLWQELHEFERMGFILDTMLSTGILTNLETVSIRNWWRPEDDPHTDKTWISDPVYVVSGAKKQL